MHHMWTDMKTAINRRSFVKNGLATAGLATAGAGFLATTSSALAEPGPEEHSGRLTKGDAALLRFAAVAEILETDFWVQYNELAGVQDNEFPGGGGGGNPAYAAALTVLDSDMAQYVHDNTDDESDCRADNSNRGRSLRPECDVLYSTQASAVCSPKSGLMSDNRPVTSVVSGKYQFTRTRWRYLYSNPVIGLS